MRHWIQEVWCAASLILLLASLSVSADTDGQHDIYIVTGVHGRSLPHYWSTLLKDQVKYFDGVYQRVKTSVGDFFAKRGFRPRSVNYFIYNVTQEDINSWVLGLSSQEHLNYCDPQDCECNNGVNYTRTFEDFAEAIFKRNKTAAPNLFSDIGTNWLTAYDGTKEGQSLKAKNSWDENRIRLESSAGIQVFPIAEKLSGKRLAQQGGILKEEGVLCESQVTRKWLFFKKLKDRRDNICDEKCQCRYCWDKALCKGVEAFSTVKVLREQRLRSKEGFFCADQQDFWAYIGNSDTQICDNKCQCKNCWDEEGCVRMGNITREQLIAEKGMETEDGVACEVLGMRWVVIKKESRETCDLKCDCKTCWDEFYCSWTLRSGKQRLGKKQILEAWLSAGSGGSSVNLASHVFNITANKLETEGGHNTGLGVFCSTKLDSWQHILLSDKEFCDFKCDCQKCNDELNCPWIYDRSGQQKAIMKVQDRIDMVSVIFNMTTDQLKVKGGVSTSKNIFCLEKQGSDTWVYFDRVSRHPFHCNLIDECIAGVDEEGCNFFTTEVSETLFNISKEARRGRRGMRVTRKNHRGPKRLDGVFCENEESEWIHIGESDPSWCNVRYNCLTGLDEQFCPWFVSTSIRIPINTTLVMFLLGFLLFLVFTLGQSKQVQKSDQSEQEVSEVMDAVDFLIDSIQNLTSSASSPALPDSRNRKEAFDVIHKTPGGMRLLLGSAFNFIIEPTNRHNIAEFIQKEEEKVHLGRKQNWMTCIRLKSGNDSATQEFLDSLEKPGIVKYSKYKLKTLYIWTAGVNHHQASTGWRKLWIKSKALLIIGILPLLKAAFYILDYVKDFCLFLFLYHRMDFIDEDCSLLQGLVIFHGTTILVSGLITGISIQLNNDIIQLDNIDSPCCKTFLRILFFLCTPLMPVAIILRAVRFSLKKEQIIGNWITNPKEMSISRAWRLYDGLASAKNKVMVAYSDLKIVEASAEAVFQMFTLLVFIIASILHPEKSGLGLLKNDSWYEYAFLVLSLLTSYVTIMLSILTSMKIRKKGNLSLWSKVLLSVSFSLQLASRLLIMVPTAILALPSVTQTLFDEDPSLSEFPEVLDISNLVTVKIDRIRYERVKRSEGSTEKTCQHAPEAGPALSVLTSGLLLCLPLLVHWILLATLYHMMVPSFRLLCKKSRFIHILANTWVTLPVREPRHQIQVHKAQEQMMSIILVSVNLALTAIFTACIIEPRQAWFPSLTEKLGLSWQRESSSCHLVVGGTEFLLFFGCPSLLCYTLGCGVLLLYYKTSHPWRDLGEEREQHCCGKIGSYGVPLRTEKPVWQEKEGIYNVAVFQPEESILLQTLQMQPMTRSDITNSSENSSTIAIREATCSIADSSTSPQSSLASIKNSFSKDQHQHQGLNAGDMCSLQRFTEYAFE